MLTIVWDVDDVLNELIHEWFHYGWLPEHPGCGIQFSELIHNPPHEALDATREQYLASMDRFRVTERGIHLTANPQALAWFQEHGHRFRHMALTARPLETAPEVAAWVLRHFGNWIRCFGVVPTRSIPGVPVYDQNKGAYLEWVRCGNVLVDDSDENIRYAQALGLHTFQVAQPWNQSKLPLGSVLQQLTLLAGV